MPNMPLATLSRFILAVAALLSLLAATPATAQTFEPDLGQTLDWLESARPGTAELPADAYEVTRHAMASEPVLLPLDEVPGRPFNVLDPPPMKTAYYKYPIYTALGLPRDLVDGLFGFVGFIPIVNLGVVGIGYEVVPTQVLLRDYRDWHGWGGTRNKNGHGWIDSDGWGWFPNYNQTRFESVNKRKLERFRNENEKLASELQELNRGIEARNAAIESRQATARDYALYWIENGDPREAVSWILPAHRAYPLEEESQGVLVAALALYADDPDAPSWVEPLLWEKLTSSLSRVQRSAEARLEALQLQHPDAYSPARALVYIKTVMGETDDALDVAEKSFLADPADAGRARLYFETALTSRDAEKATVAFERLEAANVERAGAELLADRLETLDDGLEMLRLRLALLNDEAEPVRDALQARTERSPSNAYYHYYLACSELALAPREFQMSDRARVAGAHFEKAGLLADNDPLRVRSNIAMTFLRSLSGEARDRDDSPSSGFSGIGF